MLQLREDGLTLRPISVREADYGADPAALLAGELWTATRHTWIAFAGGAQVGAASVKRLEAHSCQVCFLSGDDATRVRALRLLAAHYFRLAPSLRRVEAMTPTTDAAWPEGAGFHREGVLRAYFGDGGAAVLFALTRADLRDE